MKAFDVGRVIAGKYRLERPLAQGGMGAVWVARHLQLDVEMAIKRLGRSYANSVEARARFEREAKACAQLRSPHVVQVHDYGIEEGSPFLVMELLEGEDLGARIRRQGRLSVAEAVRLLIPVCKALRRAHDAGIVHRDIKPTNVFLSRVDEEDSVKVLDFGIVKVKPTESSGHATQAGVVIGTPNYMSPEQVRNRDVDHRSDLWSLGVVFFQAITGELPFPGDDVGDVLVEICTDPIPVASRIVPTLGPAVDQLLARALTRDRAGRFQSARELAEALESLASAEAERVVSAPALPESGTLPQVAALPEGVVSTVSLPSMASLLGDGGPTSGAEAIDDEETSRLPGIPPITAGGPARTLAVPTPMSTAIPTEARTAPGLSSTLVPALDGSTTRSLQRSRRGPVIAVLGLAGLVVLGAAMVAVMRSPTAPAAVDTASASPGPTAALTAPEVVTGAPRPDASAAEPAAAAVASAPSVDIRPAPAPSAVASATPSVRPSSPVSKARPAARAPAPAKRAPSQPAARKRDPTFGF
jgi:eukaryotic-like serine/threonine-protein kinase